MKDAGDPFIVSHSYRTFLFGLISVGHVPDEEAAFVASILHDIGLTSSYISDRGFEKVGAATASRLLTEHGWTDHRTQTVIDAIVDHTNPTPNEVPESRVVQAGAAFDVAGIPDSLMSDDRVGEVLDRYPRTDFPQQILEAYWQEIERHPTGVFADLERHFDFSRMIEINPLDQVSHS
ncbi:MAG TPA: HD domain-containing protein [Acidimicrobiia bacterium]|nr:HD domain-containing protein [Acidimicrobiia bacterium]